MKGSPPGNDARGARSRAAARQSSKGSRPPDGFLVAAKPNPAAKSNGSGKGGRKSEAPRSAPQKGATPSDPIKPAVRRSTAGLGSLIKQSRSGRYSLEALASRAGLSPSLLSQIERGRGNPSFLTLGKIADALEIPLGSFLQFRGPAAIDGMVVRKSRRKKILLPNLGLTYELLTPDLERKLAMLRTLVPAGFDSQERSYQHPGDECLLIAEGQLEVFVGTEHFKLKKGDSITYDSGQQHWWRNRGPGRAEVIWAVSPPPTV